MAQEQRIFGFAVTLITIPATAVSAMPIFPMNNQANVMIQYVSGGSLELFNMNAGASAGSDPAAGSSVVLTKGYLFAAAEKLGPYNGSPRFYLCATNASAVARLVIGLSEPAL
jgi:hypothetical protein